MYTNNSFNFYFNRQQFFQFQVKGNDFSDCFPCFSFSPRLQQRTTVDVLAARTTTVKDQLLDFSSHILFLSICENGIVIGSESSSAGLGVEILF
ncbi:hypothetical protein L6452_18815 [Arctium lappa]|uniref:Uncharacterized protein n=1 Tax=Arctium lappa TaxID=4217 RepID=A0ACB9C783_ARCLA|nr:hypothetical protein L6452_18815 [Arctium lappa]